MSRLAIITFITRDGVDIDNTLPGGGHISNALPGVGGPVDPGYGHGSWGGHPGNALPGGGGHPGHALPGGGHISLLPVFPFDPTRPDAGLPGEQPGIDNSLPGGGGRPDNTLPSGRPPHPGIVPGGKFIVKWLACQGLILVPDHGLPETPEPK